MRQMVTAGFYDRSRLALWMFEAIGREYDDMALWARELRYEAFPQTCTWGIEIWEFAYGIETDGSFPLEFRRQRVLSKRLQRPPINPGRIEEALRLLTGCQVKVTENVGPYKVRVEVDGSGGVPYDTNEASRVLRRIKPSHISFVEIVNSVYGKAPIYAAAAAACIYIKMTVEVKVFGLE